MTDLAPTKADLVRRETGMMMTTAETVSGYRIVETIGLVRGNTVRVRNIGVDLLAAFRNLVGGEIAEYTRMLAQSREQSLDRMRAQALSLGANAIVCVRFTTSTVMQGAAEILAYGTAVVIQPDGDTMARRG